MQPMLARVLPLFSATTMSCIWILRRLLEAVSHAEFHLQCLCCSLVTWPVNGYYQRMDALPKVMCIVDTETTGMRPPYARLVDIGIIRVEDGEVVERFETLINPGIPIPYVVSRVHGIYDNHVARAPKFSAVSKKVHALLDGATFVAHNAAFDRGFIVSELWRSGLSYDPVTICTVKLSRALYPQMRSHSLDSIIDRFSIEMRSRHRALPDAEAVWEFLKGVGESGRDADIAKAVTTATTRSKKASSPR